MNRRLVALFLWHSVAMAGLLTVRESQATLGESAATIDSDRRALSAVQRATTARKGYKVQEIQSEVAKVREYVSSSGIIFAIAWSGVTHPDLTPLLGSYAADYRQSLQQVQRHQGRRYSRVKANRVMVEKWGHMRNQQGRAYVPALVPPGVSIDEIK